MIQTNEATIIVKRDRIQERYDIFKLFNRHLYKVLEGLSDDLPKVLSVVYGYNEDLYAIFDKDCITCEQLKEHASKYIKEDGKIVEVIKVNIMDEQEVSDLSLCRLFMNMIPRVNSIKNYNNITGQLLYVVSTCNHGDSKITYKIKIEQLQKEKQRYVLNIGGESYNRSSEVLKSIDLMRNISKEDREDKRKKVLESPRYYVDQDDYKLKKAYYYMKSQEVFVRYSGGINVLKYFLDDLNIDDFSKFKNSVKGILWSFLKDFKELFSEYVTIDFPEYVECKKVSKNSKSSISKLLITQKFNEGGIQIIDYVKNEESKQLSAQIIEKLQSLDIENCTLDENKKYHIILVNDKAKYIKQKEVDPYQKDLSAQHLIVENCFKDGAKGINDVQLNVILQELLIKEEVNLGKISLFDWNYDDDVTFVKLLEKKDKKVKTETFAQCIVKSDGTFDCIKVDESQPELYNEYFNYFKNNQDNEYMNNSSIEMVMMYKDIKLVIYKTPLFLMSDVEEIASRLKCFKKNKCLKTSALKELLLEFKEYNKKYEQEISNVIERIEKEGKEKYTYHEIINGVANDPNRLIKLRSRFGKDFNVFAREQKGIILNPALKSDVLKSVQHIHEIRKKGDEQTIMYYVGSKESMKNKLINANPIRRIYVMEGHPDEEFFNKFYEMLAVDYVKNGTFTVLPFVNKYMKELYNYKYESTKSDGHDTIMNKE